MLFYLRSSLTSPEVACLENVSGIEPCEGMQLYAAVVAANTADNRFTCYFNRALTATDTAISVRVKIYDNQGCLRLYFLSMPNAVLNKLSLVADTYRYLSL